MITVEQYADFSQRFHQVVINRRIPIEGTLEVTLRCPLTCAHCYNNLPMSDHEARHRELSYEDYCRLLDEIADAGCLWLLFTGGEIFARRDFLEIYTYAKRKGFLITLFTNGTLITPKIADYLVEWRPFAIEITLYGYTKETYERLTGIPGSYEKCIRAIHLLLERNLPLKLKTVAVSMNRHEIRDMQRFAEELGVGFKFDAMMNPRIDCSMSPLEVRLTPAEIVAFDLDDPRRMAEWQTFSTYFTKPAQSPEHRNEVYHCGGGVSAFAIDPYGDMSICVLSQVDKYNVRTGSFTEGWNEYLRRVRAKPRTTINKCVDCQIKSMCGMCPATGELESGHAETPVDFLCHVAHLRAHFVGLEVPAHGDCEYCKGGSRYHVLQESIAAIEDEGRKPWQPPRGARKSLPVLSQPSQTSGVTHQSGGCSACNL